MFRLIKKDIPLFAISIFVIYPLSSITIALLHIGTAQFAIVQNIFLLYALSVGVISMIEFEDDQFNGMMIKSILPLYPAEIIGSKFILIFIAVALLAIFCVGSAFFTLSIENFQLHNKIIVANFRYCLWLLGFIQIGSLCFGFINFMKFGLVGTGTVLFTIGVLVQFIYVQKYGIDAFMTLVQKLSMHFLHVNFWQSLLVTVLVYVILFFIAYMIKNLKKG